MNPLRGNIAIAGIGESALGKVPGRTALQLMTDAACAAVADSGLDWGEIDGLLTTPLRTETWGMPCGILADAFGLKPNYLATLDLAGAVGCAMIHHAAMAIASGECSAVLCVAGQPMLSHRSRSDAVKAMAEGGSSDPQFEVPYGPLVPSLYALLAQRHMAEFGTKPEQLAEVAVAIRGHAALNPAAQKREPITVQDVLSSRMITSPLHVLDCALVSDGAGAAIVTTRERARDLRRKPVVLLGQGYGLSHSHAGDYRDLTTTGAVNAGRKAFASSGLRPSNIDVAELYDCFTITVIVELEDLGFCKKGEGGAFVEGGRIRLGGELPVTTHGGLLSCAHPGLGGGFLHVLEGVRQLRGEAGERQVQGAKTAFVHGNGGIVAIHCSVVLGTEETV